jgi:hypothetical protein
MDWEGDFSGEGPKIIPSYYTVWRIYWSEDYAGSVFNSSFYKDFPFVVSLDLLLASLFFSGAGVSMEWMFFKYLLRFDLLGKDEEHVEHINYFCGGSV